MTVAWTVRAGSVAGRRNPGSNALFSVLPVSGEYAEVPSIEASLNRRWSAWRLFISERPAHRSGCRFSAGEIRVCGWPAQAHYWHAALRAIGDVGKVGVNRFGERLLSAPRSNGKSGRRGFFLSLEYGNRLGMLSPSWPFPQSGGLR